ncbi:MAG TPA: heavy metal translocating P-type ATPase [Micropepsaceae bacterium]|nr:heavy metal translocating P-type ATPase [Micropepsaceae bacterium]
MGALTLSLPAANVADDLSRCVRKQANGISLFEAAVRGARCANCIAKIEAGVNTIVGIENARLNLSTGKLSVEWQGDAVDPRTVIQRVRALGYEAQPFNAALTRDADREEGRFLLRCLAVAGFGMVFVMGLTDAIWYGGQDLDAATRDILFRLAAVVSIPVTLYAGQPFFRSAYRSIAKRRTNMDVPIGAAIVLSLALSFYQAAYRGTQIYFDAAPMLAFVLLIGRYLDFMLRDRASGAAQHLVSMQSVLVRRLSAGGEIQTVAAQEVLPGDRILLTSGERTPVDGRIENDTIEADVSLVTGESLPVFVNRGDLLRAGSIILGKSAVLTASARADDSLMADLARLLEAGQQTRGLYVRLADRAARAYVPFVSGLAILIAISWLAAGAALSVAITNAITVLIITCPCALGLAVPAVQIIATSRLFDRGLLVKSGDALERLAEIDMAVFDKTGTLTAGKPELLNADAIPRTMLARAAEIARTSRHPLARALAAAAGDGPAANVREIPGCGLESERDGIVERLGSASWCGGESIGDTSELWFRSGDAPPLRFAFSDVMRSDALQMIGALKNRGIKVEMLSGDSVGPTAHLAAQTGISDWKSGADPKEKAARMEQLRAQGHRVLMVGDGLNDAGALALAHVSISAGSAADATQMAADIVLRGNSLMPLVEAIDIARKSRRLVFENFALALLYNLTAIPMAAFGLVTPLIASASMAGSSLFVMLNALRAARGSRP